MTKESIKKDIRKYQILSIILYLLVQIISLITPLLMGFVIDEWLIINKKKFHAYFISSSLFGFLSILVTILLLNFINSLFTLINKKWNDLEKF